MRKIIFYRLANGACPVQEYLDTLSSKQAEKVFFVLDLIESLDIVPVKFFKKMEASDNIWEARIQYGGNIFRLLGFFDDAKLIVLTHGFQKKTQKTPKQHIELAESRKRDYLSRR